MSLKMQSTGNFLSFLGATHLMIQPDEVKLLEKCSRLYLLNKSLILSTAFELILFGLF